MSTPAISAALPPKKKPAEEAVVVPNVARALLSLVMERGLSPARLCRGLGFSYESLLDLQTRLSYRQTRLLILRTQALLDDEALGFSTGQRQTPLSWGLPGLAMLTCENLGEAVNYGIAHQNDTGALLEHHASQTAGEFTIEVTPKTFDSAIEPFLVEEAFSSAVAIVRALAGPTYSPLRVELAYPRPAYAQAYRTLFRCPVHFGTCHNRLVNEARWLSTRLPGYDEITCAPLRVQLDSILGRSTVRNELIESVRSQLRAGLDDSSSLDAMAARLNMSGRTLRRKLTELGYTYRGLVDEARHEHACDLLRHSSQSIATIAQALGFSDAHAFRRAFKRWSGVLPGLYRKQ